MKAAIMAVLIDQRTKDAPLFQQVLTDKGCIIQTRLGIHSAGAVCADDGLVLLHLLGSKEEIEDLEQRVNSIENIRAKTMYLDY